MAQCKSCSAPILWLRNPKTGRMAPIDAYESQRGNIGVDGQEYALCNAAMGHVECGVHRGHHTNHFATCPFSHLHHTTPRGRS